MPWFISYAYDALFMMPIYDAYIAISKMKNTDYCCIISGISKS